MEATKTKVSIERVKIERIIDESPDTSYLGKYTDELGPGVVVRALGEFYEKLPAPMERDTDGRFWRKGAPEVPSRGREYRGFLPYAGGAKPGTEEYYRYGMLDFKRMESLQMGDWSYIGIRAYATVKYLIGDGSYRLETLSSGGAWGIESDSTESYLREIEDEELSEVKAHLETFGVDTSDFDSKVEREE